MGSFCRRDLMARVEEVLSSMKRAHTPHAAVCGDVLSGSGGLCSDGAIFLRRDRGLVGRRFTYVPSTTYLQPRMLHGMFRGEPAACLCGEYIPPRKRGTALALGLLPLQVDWESMGNISYRRAR
jgi:hypothetical protein